MASYEVRWTNLHAIICIKGGAITSHRITTFLKNSKKMHEFRCKERLIRVKKSPLYLIKLNKIDVPMYS